MKNKVWDSFDEAVADVWDGAVLMMFSWGPAGTPQNLIQALRRRGVRDLTLITHNVIPAWVGSHVCTEEEVMTPFFLVPQARKLVTAWPRPIGAATAIAPAVEEAMDRLELEITSHGVLAERIRCGGSGIGGFYSPVGLGTALEQGKEKRWIDGKEYLLEKPLRADFAFLRAHKTDRRGNCVYRGSGRGANPYMAMAAQTVIVETDRIVEVGDLDPEAVVTPGIFVDRIVPIPQGALGSCAQRKELVRRHLKGG